MVVYLNSPHPIGGAINQPSENPGLYDTEVGVVSGPAGATCIRLQNMEDESRSITQTCTVRSEQSQKSNCTCL